MAITFYPKAGQIFVCNLKEFRPPEMGKIRPVVVISPRLPFRSEIVTIVPLSLTAPVRDVPFNYRLSRNYHPSSPDDLPVWAKADMILNLSRGRLNGFKVGRRQWKIPQMTPEDLAGAGKPSWLRWVLIR
jgi:uncharacterized protein YifN (PemK superfamily)